MLARIAKLSLSFIARSVGLTLLFLLFLTPLAYGEQITVTQDGSGDYRTIQAAIDAASSGDTVYVKAGTYKEHIRLKSEVTLQGSGRERTTIRYTGNAPAISVEKVPLAKIAGLTIEYAGSFDQCALWVETSRITLSDAVVTGAVLSGIEVQGVASEFIVENSLVHGNQQHGCRITDCARASIKNSEFFENEYAGISITGGTPLIENNKIHENKESGIEVFGASGETITIRGNEIFGNAYAGISIKGESNLCIENNIIHNGKRGGIYIYGNARGEIRNNEIFENTHTGIAVSGGADLVIESNVIHDGERGGIYVYGNTKGVIRLNEIYNHDSSGITVKEGSIPLIENNTIALNHEHGILACDSARPVIKNNIIAFNGAAGIDTSCAGKPQGTPTVVYNDLWGNGSTSEAFASIRSDPQFVDLNDRNFHLRDVSPCIGAGKGGVDLGAHPYLPPNQPPNAKFSLSPSETNIGKQVRFNALSSSDPDGSVSSYAWSFGDDSTSSGSFVSHRYGRRGTFTVTLTITDNDGATDSTTRKVRIVNQPPTAEFTYSVLSTSGAKLLIAPRVGDRILFDPSASLDPDGEIANYKWDWESDGVYDRATKSGILEHQFKTTGDHQVTLQVTDNDGATSSTTQKVRIVNQPPMAEFTYSVLSTSGAKLLIAPRVGDRILFDPSASFDPDGEIVNYEWDWESDGVYDTATKLGTLEHQFKTTGDHQVTLRVTDNDGATSSTTQKVRIVNQPPMAEFTYSVLSTSGAKLLIAPRVGDRILFDPSASSDPDGEIVNYEWDWESDGVYDTATKLGTLEHQFKTTGDHQVTLRVTDNDGATAALTKTVSVVNDLPQASFIFTPSSAKVDQTITFDPSQSKDPDGSIESYRWSFGDGETLDSATAKKVTHQYSSAGTYTVGLTIIDNAGGEDTVTKSVSVRLNQPPQASFTYTPASPKAGETVEFDAGESTDPDGTIVSWEWEFGDGVTRNGSEVRHLYEKAGAYDITLTVADDSGATDVATRTISVRPVLKPPQASFTFTPSSATTQDTISFVDQSEDTDGEVVAWKWDFGDGETASGKESTHSYRDNGPYTVTLTVTDNDDLTDTASREITVENVPPEAHFTVLPEKRIAGTAVTFDASSSKDLDGSIKKYEWDFNDDAEVDMTGSIVAYVFEHGATFPVTLYATDDDGASTSIKQEVTVRDREVEPGQIWGLIIGVAEYPELPEHNLDYPATDAQAIYDFLIGAGGLEENHVKLLLNDRATLTGVRGGLQWLWQRAQPDDLVIFYFSGHGYQGEDDDGDETDGTDEFLVFYDTQQGFIESTAFRDDEFGEFLDKVDTEHVLVLFDSCYSGGASRGIKGLQSGAKPLPGYVDIFNDFSLEGKLILTASTEAQLSWEDHKLGHGVFTYFLLQGLEGEADEDKNYRITAQELYDYVAREVEDFVTRERGTSQQPQMTGKGTAGVIVSTMNQPPQADFTWDLQEVIREGDEVVFHDKSADKDGQVASWEWDFGDSTTFTAQDPPHSYEQPGSYMVNLIVTDDDGATAEASHELVVVANQVPEAAFTWLPEDPFLNETVYFIDSSTDPDGKIASWEWSFGDGNESTEPVPSHEYLQQGKYPVTLMVTDDSGATSRPFTVEISIAKTSFVRRFIKDKGYLISLVLADRERARVNAPVWIYTRSIEGGILIEDVKAEGVITSLHPLLVKVTTYLLPSQINPGDLVKLKLIRGVENVS